jgi:hypothetical protein
MWRYASICALAMIAGGCRGSRWAREDADYAHKYPHHRDDVLKTTKQAVDARHVIGKRGVYAGFAGRDEPFGAGVEAGVFAYPRSWLEARAAGAVLAHESERPLSGGGLIGMRIQPPTRLAPFVGMGGYLGWAGWEDAAMDSVDNDDDGFTDELGEDQSVFVAALVPELGMHYWITSRLRLTSSADYRLTTSGRDSDSMYYGLSLAWLGPSQSSPVRSKSSSEEWSFAPSEIETTAANVAAPTSMSATTPLATEQPPIAYPDDSMTPAEFVDEAKEEIITSFHNDLP